MADYTLKIRPHYTGLFVGHCAEYPSLVVMGQDHDEVTVLAAEAVALRHRHSRAEPCSPADTGTTKR